MSLRKAINAKCKDCIYDPVAPGTWRQQVTLCAVTTCPLWDVRPTTEAEIPGSVLRFYGVELAEFQGKEARQGPTADKSNYSCGSAESVDSQPGNGHSAKEV